MSCTEGEDVQNLATSFENLGRPPTIGITITKLSRSKFEKNLASESVGTFSLGNNKVESKLVASYIPQVPSAHNPIFSYHDLAIDESPPVFCSKCCFDHKPRQACPFLYCDICYRTHKNWGCPYESILPQGAEFDRVNFTAVCAFDDSGQFDEEKWACTWCRRKVAKLNRKYCCICEEDFVTHCSYECPKDVERAAVLKASRDHDLAFPKKWASKGLLS
ncbi:cysteine/Histidine-rich C1 domain family protein [Striga asiatica]|uniref:Cysteine/Histidine-rich C1 domain family protein n=1 Tax=Striga asiatica TaxID=4170 RepID=A0A5A7RDK9_STRAF|nr:cysteine/Histidine-rich C1 domain family protein [Striga asiatica]